MTQGNSEVPGIASGLEAALERIRALEHEVAQQNRTIQALREDHSFREGVIEKAAEGVCVCHDIVDFPFVKFTVWNRRMIEITGCTMEEINERGWYQTVYPDPEIQERARQRMERMRQGDDLRFERWEITRADGAKRLIAISTSILTTGDGEVHVLGLMHDFTAEEQLQAEAMLARVDELTHLKNRRGFRENAELLFRLAERQKQSITVAYLDIDNLKSVNDALGHAEGDQVLKAVGQALGEWARSTDVVGRLGGDKFGLVLLAMRAADAPSTMTRLHQRLLDVTRGGGWPTGVSMGVVTFSSAIPDFDSAMAHADAAMYKAKKEGRNRLILEESAG